MTSQRDPDHRDIARQLREELERIRTSEARVEEALDSVRGARRRVEELALSLERALEHEEDHVRALVREELEATRGASRERAAGPAGLPWRSAPGEGWPRGRPTRAAREADEERAGADSPTPGEASPSGGRDGAASGEPSQDDPHDDPLHADEGRRARRRLALVAVVSVVAVVVVGWLAFQGVREGVAPGPVVLSSDRGVAGDAASPADEAPPEEDGEGAAAAAAATAGPLATLPEGPEAHAELYDSLFAARSPLFGPLLDSVAALSEDASVDDAVAAWGDDGTLTAKERDLVQSALVQWILMREIDSGVEIDGELLRNPCRGTSCSALLNLWQMGRTAFGFPEIPDDAPTNVDALRTVEAMLVLERMQDLHVGAAGGEG